MSGGGDATLLEMLRFRLRRSSGLGRWAAAAAWLPAAAVLACGPSPPDLVMRPVERFVGRKLDARVDTLLLPTATIDDDTRFVLRAPPTGVLAWHHEIPARDGTARIELPLVPPFDRATKLLASFGIEAGSKRRWRERHVVRTQQRSDAVFLSHELRLPRDLEGTTRLHVTISAVGLGITGFSRYETREVPIPEDARLEFALGILEPEFGRDAVAFELSACEKDACETIFAEILDPTVPEQRGWHDRRISLEALAGQRRHFVFGARRLSAASEFSLPVWANPTLYAPEPRRPEDVNVILFSIDTLRADHLTSYGYAHDTAPFIDARLARRGVLFESLTAASPVTAPSHMTMFTALQPITHGVTDGLKGLSPALRTLPELLRARRIETAAFTENGWVSTRQGFGRGFNVFSENKSPDINVPLGEVDVTLAQARRWLAWNRDKHFFLFVHTYQVHEPYAPPKRYADLFRRQDGRDVSEGSPIHLRRRADYDREIRFVDDELRTFFGELERLGVAGRTVSILTADHGEEFREHGLLSHGRQLYEESVRVPLIFQGAGIPEGRRVETPVAHVHLMPTILELFAAQAPPGQSARSLLPLIRGEEIPAAAAGPVYSEAWLPLAGGRPGDVERFEPPAISVRSGSRKASRIRDGGGLRYEYYDLSEDPGEQRNLHPERRGEASDLFGLLDAYEAERRARSQKLLGELEPRAPALRLDPEQEEKLRALGYLIETEPAPDAHP
jgi:arylsulfatase A-like enzyme